MKKHCSAPPQSISNKKLCWKLQRGMQDWLSQLSPQGGGLSHKLIEHSHMIGEFHLEPSRYIKPYRNEEFTEVPLYFPKSPQITCVIVTLCPLLRHLCTSLLNAQRPAQAHPASISTMHCLLFCPFQSAHTYRFLPLCMLDCELHNSHWMVPKVLIQFAMWHFQSIWIYKW